MGTCTSSLADDIAQITKEHHSSLKEPIRRSLSLISNYHPTTKSKDTPPKKSEPKTAPRIQSRHLLRILKQQDSHGGQGHKKEQGGAMERRNAPTSPVEQWLAYMDPELKRSLYKNVRPDDYDSMGMTKVHRAAEMGNSTHIKFLLAIGSLIDISTTEAHGHTPALVFAATNGHSECVQLLLDAGADVNNSDDWGNSALFKAACYNHVDCVSKLLKSGADPNKPNRWGALPVQYAALQGHQEIIKVLLENGACPDSAGEKNVPLPLSGAAIRGYPGCVHEMLKHRPNLEKSHSDNETALYLGLKHFLLHCNGYNTIASSSSSSLRFQCIHSLLLAGSRVNQDVFDLTHCSDMIPYLVTEEYILIIKLLLQAFPYGPRASDSFIELFEHATRLGKHKWELIRLICSTGFTPTRHQLEELSYTFMDSQYTQLDEFCRSPRTLMDLCRQTVRSSLSGQNVICDVQALPLPKLMQNYISLKNCSFYTF